ncbi:hypothetical protein J6590_106737, partial [Homalodisca vitripennis]
MFRILSPFTRITTFSQSSIDCVCTNVEDGNVTVTVLDEEISDRSAFSSHNSKRVQLPATRITPTKQSSIDWICSNIDTEKLDTKVIHAGISDHTAQSCEVNFAVLQDNPLRMSRCLRRKNLQELKCILGEENWSNILQTEDADAAFERLSHTVRLAMDAACPQRKFKTRHKLKPKYFADHETNRLKDRYLIALSKYEVTGSIDDKEESIR